MLPAVGVFKFKAVMNGLVVLAATTLKKTLTTA